LGTPLRPIAVDLDLRAKADGDGAAGARRSRVVREAGWKDRTPVGTWRGQAVVMTGAGSDLLVWCAPGSDAE
jgi:hypothetical protein